MCSGTKAVCVCDHVHSGVMCQRRKPGCRAASNTYVHVPFGVTYDKIGTIQRRLAWPLHKDDTLVQSGSATADNIYAPPFFASYSLYNPRRSYACHPSLSKSTLIIHMCLTAKLHIRMCFTAILCLLRFGPLQPTSIVDFPWE
jgi:hypothetical protein